MRKWLRSRRYWKHDAEVGGLNASYWRERYYEAATRIDLALKELGVVQPGYPAPVASAIEILSAPEKVPGVQSSV